MDMSSAGHIMNMINTIKQNRAMQKSRRDDYRNNNNNRTVLSNQGFHVPNTPYERIYKGSFAKKMSIAVFVIFFILILLVVYFFVS